MNRLPRETLLSATLYAVPIPPPGSSSETNKQRRVPEALGWVTTPLFNFRQYVHPPCPHPLGKGLGTKDMLEGVYRLHRLSWDTKPRGSPGASAPPAWHQGR